MGETDDVSSILVSKERIYSILYPLSSPFIKLCLNARLQDNSASAANFLY
jgi:hypothetical protein